MHSPCRFNTVYPQPQADFTFSPLVPQAGDVVNFTDQSINALSWNWDFGNGNSSTTENPSPNYEDAGIFHVTLFVAGNNNCTDSTSYTFLIEEALIYYIPNSFTLNSDEFNNTFNPVFTSGFDAADYHFTIFNRWGEVVFETYDHLLGWDGTYAGKPVADNVYTWTVAFGNINNDERHLANGHVTVLR